MSAHDEQVVATQQRLTSIISNAFTTLNISLGVKLGLFEKLAAISSAEKPVTSQELADACSYRERYVREWLNGLVVAQIVQVDAEGKRYWLNDNMKTALQGFDMLTNSMLVPMLALVHDKIAACFDRNGPRGCEYNDFKAFHSFMSKRSADADGHHIMLNVILPAIDGLVERLQRGCTVLDVGCGQGWHTSYMAKAFPKSTFYAFDSFEEPIKFAKETFAHVTNVHYSVCDARKMRDEWTGKFDVIILMESLHIQARPDLCLQEMHRVMRDDGVALVIDIKQETNVLENIGDPMSPYLYTTSLMHCMPASLNEPDGLGLGACWGRQQALQMFDKYGFKNVSSMDTGDQMKFLYILRKEK